MSVSKTLEPEPEQPTLLHAATDDSNSLRQDIAAGELRLSQHLPRDDGETWDDVDLVLPQPTVTDRLRRALNWAATAIGKSDDWEVRCRQLAADYHLSVKDFRHKGGCFWIELRSTKTAKHRHAAKELKAMGFKFHPPRGFWKR